MKRYAHYWWPLKGTSCPSNIVVLDCDGERHMGDGGLAMQYERMTAWHLISVGVRRGLPMSPCWQSGERGESLVAALASFFQRRERTWVFCSPSSRILPMIGFWGRLESGEYTLAGRDRRQAVAGGNGASPDTSGICIVEDPPTVIAVRAGDLPGSLTILDIRNWGIELLSERMAASERCEQYLSGICDCLRTLRLDRPAPVRCTAGSQAVSSLRQESDCIRLHCHTHAAALNLERGAYHGGRCECFRIGDIAGPVYHLDVRSMYPSICLTLPIPVSLRRYSNDNGAAERIVGTATGNCAAHVRVRTAQPRWPLRRRDETIYPVGQFDTSLAGPELTDAVSCGAILRVYAAAEYTCAPLLAGFYGQWLAALADARGAGRRMETEWIKRVMNALPGRFGEPGRRWVTAPQRMENGPYGVWWERGPDGQPARHRNIAWHTQREERDGESYWSMPAIAAWITSAGRARLWNYLEAAGRANVWYVDTDSVICGQAGYDRLLRAGHIRNGEAGYLRLVGQHSRCSIYGIRHYVLDDTVSCAGVPRGDIRPGETRGEYWWRQHAAAEIALGHSPTGAERRVGPPPPEPYRHGVVGPDGRVSPLVME